MRIGVLYICIGKYKVFWDEFYESCNKNFLPSSEKEYFVFTDDVNLKTNDDTRVYKWADLGWPYNTLYRFRMFNSIRENLKSFDYLFFFNANTYFNTVINENEVLPIEDDYVFVKHFKFAKKANYFYAYERNKKSLAYVPYGIGKVYIQACVMGGKTQQMLEMFDILDKNIAVDEDKGIIARWHDESHVNAFIQDKKCLLLEPNYASNKYVFDEYPPRITMRLKTDYYPLDTIRNQKSSFCKKLENWMKNQFDKVRDTLHYILRKR